MKNIDIACTKLSLGGGAERYTLDVIGELHRRGMCLHCYSYFVDPSVDEFNYVDMDFIDLSWVPQKLRDLRFDVALAKRRASRSSNPLLAFSRVRNANVVVSMGTHRGWLAATNKYPSLSDREQIHREKKCYQTAKYIISHSKRLSMEVCKYYDVSEDKVITAYPPVRTSRFFPVSDAERALLRRRYGFADDEFIIVVPSMDHKRKGLSEVSRAVAALDLPIRIVVAGRRTRDTETVTALGYVTDIENLYRAADLTALASTYEPFGLAAVESVLCGTPALVSSNVGSLEVLPKNAVYAYNSSSIDDLSDIIREIFHSSKADSNRITAEPAEMKEKLDLSRHVSGLVEKLEIN